MKKNFNAIGIRCVFCFCDQTKEMRLVVSCLLLLVFCLLSVAGCQSFKSDVSDEEEFLGGYSKKIEYVIMRDVFIQYDNTGLSGKRLILIPESSYHSFKREGGRHSLAPVSIEQYRVNPEKATATAYGRIPVVGVVAKGTKFRLSRIERNRGLNFFFGTHDEITLFATILTGEFSGKEADITDISVYYRKSAEDGPFIYKPEEVVVSAVP